MDDPPRTLAEVLEPIYDYYLRSLVDDDLAGRWADDEQTIGIGVSTAFRRIRRSVWWLGRHPSGLADDTPYVVVKFDAARCLIRFEAATLDEVCGFPHAAEFRPDGRPRC